MSAGVGIDLLEIERMERALERRPQLAQRLFTESEIAYARAKPRPGRHLAARFCAKEAVAKSLALTAWNFTDVEVVREDAAPGVRLTGSAAEAAERAGVEVSLSITHTEVTAGAVALALPRGRGT
jgi:holo-[acyl-carrier protein] synthase